MSVLSSARPLRLAVHSPTPTTTLFTVTNAIDRSSHISRVARAVRLLLRALFALAVFVLFVTLVREAWYSIRGRDIRVEANPDVLRLSGGNREEEESAWEQYKELVHNWSWTGTGVDVQLDRLRVGAGVAVCTVLLYLLSRRRDTEETLLLIRGLGIQTSSSSPSYLSTPTTRFIPTTAIQDVFIHEAFTGFEVRFYLGVVVEGEKEVVVVFERLMPRRDILGVVWRGVRRVLYQQGSKEKD